MDSNRTQSDKKPEPSAESLMNDRLARSLQYGVKQFLEYWTDARIVSAHWEQNNLDIMVRLPFWLPLPADSEAGDWLASKRDIQVFRSGVRKQFKEMRSARMSNLLFSEYRKFIFAYLRIHRFSREVEKRLPTMVERRLAGRPTNRSSEAQLKNLRKDVKEIHRQLRELKKQIRVWKKLDPGLTEISLKDVILDWPPFEDLPWPKVMFRCFRALTSKYPYKGLHIDKDLVDPRSWSAKEWAVVIVQEMSRRKSGFAPAAFKLKSR
jgi:hypothetical protein